MSNINFENVLFLSGATGATTKRTPAQRWSDVLNVLDFGADPSGLTDSTAAIQAAVNAAATLAVPVNAATLVKIYFPPGNYHVGMNGVGVILPGGTQSGFWLQGDGLVSRITVNAALPAGSYVFDHPFNGTAGDTTFVISGFWFQTAVGSAGQGGTGGHIRIESAVTARIENCLFSYSSGLPVTTTNGMTCVSLGPSCFQPTIIGCNFLGPANVGSVGGPLINTVGLNTQSQSLVVINGNFIGWDTGCITGNPSATFIGCRWEEDNVGVLLSSGGLGIFDAGFEACHVAVYLQHGQAFLNRVAAKGDINCSWQYIDSTITSASWSGTLGGNGTATITVHSPCGLPRQLIAGDPAFFSASFSATILNVQTTGPGAGYNGTFACTAAAPTTSTFTGNLTLGSTSILNCTGTLPALGSVISGTGIPTGTTVTSVTGTTVVMSFLATATNTGVTVSFLIVSTFTYALPDPGSGQAGTGGNFDINSSHGFRFGAATGSVLVQCAAGGPFSVAPFGWDAGTQAIEISFFNCTADQLLPGSTTEVVWPANTVSIVCSNCSFDPPDATFNQLPGNPGTVQTAITNLFGFPAGPGGAILPALENSTFTISDSPIGTNSVGATFTGFISGTTLTVSSGLTGNLAVGDSVAGPGVMAGTSIRTTDGSTTAVVNISQTVASSGSPIALSTLYDNFGVVVTKGSSTNRALLECVSAPSNPYATLSDGTHEAIFYASIGSNINASITQGSTTLTVNNITQGGIISATDVIVGFLDNTGHTVAFLPVGTTIVSQQTGTTGGAGTYTMSNAATGAVTTTTATVSLSSTVLNVTNTTVAPSFGTIVFNGTWSLDTWLFNPAGGLRTINSQIAGTAGGVGQYQLSGLAIAAVPPFVMGAGIAGQVLTLHGTNVGTFQIGNVLTFENLFGYSLTSSVASPPAGTTQWNVAGTSKYFGPQTINAALWNVVG